MLLHMLRLRRRSWLRFGASVRLLLLDMRKVLVVEHEEVGITREARRQICNGGRHWLRLVVLRRLLFEVLLLLALREILGVRLVAVVLSRRCWPLSHRVVDVAGVERRELMAGPDQR